MTMTIILNGEPQQLPASTNLVDLLRKNGLEQKKIAVEINERIVPRSQYESTRLQAGDRLEVIQAIGGG